MRKNRRRTIYSPLKMTKELKALGEKRFLSLIVLCYVGVTLLVLLLGSMYQLEPIFIAIAMIYWILSVPQLIISGKRGQNELKRFSDANSYMVQMAQSFVCHKSIYRALKETAKTFVEGNMRNTIFQAVEYIDEYMAMDVRKAQREGLSIIEQEYDCEKIRQLHEFLITAEVRGGQFEMEFELLERNRSIWEKAVLAYRNKLSFAKLGVSIEFVMLIAICAFMLNRFPEYMRINGSIVIQCLNTIQIICLGMIYKHVDKTMSYSLLKAPKIMSKEKVERNFAFLRNYHAGKEFVRNIPFLVLALVVSIVLVVIKPGKVTIAIGILLVSYMSCKHMLDFYFTRYKLKKELMNRFPGWLFEMILLLQNESVVMAIMKSRKNAPAIMQEELKRICQMLGKNPGDVDAFMSFFADFKLQEIETTMRRLYSMSIGTAGSKEMTLMIESNLEMISKTEKNALKDKEDITVVYTYLPMLPIGASLIGYCIVLMITVCQYLLVLV